MFRKDYTTTTGRLLPSNPFSEDSFIKVGTCISHSEELCAFVESLPEASQNSIKNLLIHGLSDVKNVLLIQLQKMILLTPSKSTGNSGLPECL